jgi:hypothetical protein
MAYTDVEIARGCAGKHYPSDDYITTCMFDPFDLRHLAVFIQ